VHDCIKVNMHETVSRSFIPVRLPVLSLCLNPYPCTSPLLWSVIIGNSTNHMPRAFSSCHQQKGMACYMSVCCCVCHEVKQEKKGCGVELCFQLQKKGCALRFNKSGPAVHGPLSHKHSGAASSVCRKTMDGISRASHCGSV
jgi:hypothetical protein